MKEINQHKLAIAVSIVILIMFSAILIVAYYARPRFSLVVLLVLTQILVGYVSMNFIVEGIRFIRKSRKVKGR